MSVEITTAFVQNYKSTLWNLVQQKGSRLREAVTMEPNVVGKFTFFDQIGATAAVEKMNRHGDTPLVNTPHSRRRVSLRDWEWADLIDDQDRLRLLIDPASKYLQNAMWALGRAIDDEIIAAFLRAAATGETGSTSVAFPTATNQIVHGSVGLTIDKILDAKKILDASEVDPDDPRYMAVTAAQVKNLLNTTQVTNADYNTVKALAEGKVDTFCGFKFIRTERLAKASTTRSCIAWAKSCVGLAVASDIKGDIGVRRDKSLATQVYAAVTAGATRIQEEGVVEVQCTE